MQFIKKFLNTKKAWLKLAVGFVLFTALYYGYYLLTEGSLDPVYKSWDGPGYVLAALSMYDPATAYENNFFHSSTIEPNWTWLPAHFPLYPALIKAFSFIGYFRAGLLFSLLFSLLTLIAFYELARRLPFVKDPLRLTLPLLLLPPRYFIVSHILGSEPMFLFLLIMTLLFFRKKRHGIAAVFAALAQLTRPQGALLGLGLGLYALWQLAKTRKLRQVLSDYYPYLLVPVSLISVFGFYYLRTGSFWAFFDSVAIFNHTGSFLATFTFRADNIETYWQEVNALDYVIYFAAVLTLFRKKLSAFGLVGLCFFLPLLFLRHSDISRYALPLMPLAYLAFSEIIERREFTLAAFLMSPAVMAYAANFMMYNRAP